MIYLDNAATSFPKPSEVYEAVIDCMKTYAANPGRGSHSMAVKSALKVMETREKLGELFNVPSPLNIIFTSNATEGINIGIKGVVKAGDHVISTNIEHNSVLRTVYSLYKKGVEYTLVKVNKGGFINPESIKREVKPNTILIVVNHTSNVIGTIQPIRDIGKIAADAGILFMVDASQSAGIIPIDVVDDHIDLLAFSGHKGLLGPQGTGGLYIREGIVLDDFKTGGTGSNSSSMEQPFFLPDKFESGTLNTPGIAGLCEGVKFIERTGIVNIYKHEIDLSDYLISEFKKLSFIETYGNITSKDRCGVISFNIKEMDSSKIGYILNKSNIAVRTGYHCAPLIHETIGTVNRGTIRVSPGYFNTFIDIDNLLETIIKIYRKESLK